MFGNPWSGSQLTDEWEADAEAEEDIPVEEPRETIQEQITRINGMTFANADTALNTNSPAEAVANAIATDLNRLDTSVELNTISGNLTVDGGWAIQNSFTDNSYRFGNGQRVTSGFVPGEIVEIKTYDDLMDEYGSHQAAFRRGPNDKDIYFNQWTSYSIGMKDLGRTRFRIDNVFFNHRDQEEITGHGTGWMITPEMVKRAPEEELQRPLTAVDLRANGSIDDYDFDL